MELTGSRGFRPSASEVLDTVAPEASRPTTVLRGKPPRYGKDAHPPRWGQQPCQGSGACDAEPFGLIARHERHDRAELAEEQCEPDAGPSCLNPQSNEPFACGCRRQGLFLAWSVVHQHIEAPQGAFRRAVFDPKAFALALRSARRRKVLGRVARYRT